MAYLQLHIFDRRGTPNTVTVSGSDGRESISFTGALPYEHTRRIKADELSGVAVNASFGRISPTLCLLVIVDGEIMLDKRTSGTNEMEASLDTVHD